MQPTPIIGAKRKDLEIIFTEWLGKFRFALEPRR